METSEPPAVVLNKIIWVDVPTCSPTHVIPTTTVTVDMHVPHVIPRAKAGVAPLAIGILPVSDVRMSVGKGWVSPVHSNERDRVGRFQATQFKLLFEVVIRDETVALEQVESEKHDFDFVTFTLGHAVYNLAIGILSATGNVNCFLRGDGAVHLGLADDGPIHRVHQFAVDCKHLRTDGVQRFNLPIDHRGCSHNLCHSVVLLIYTGK